MPQYNIPYGKQSITEADIVAVTEALQHPFLTQGPKVLEFESAFAEYVGAQFAVAVANGTAALHLCTMALGVQPGDRVITTPITFAASANCVRFCGGDVVFTDIDPETILLDLEKVKTLLEEFPKGHFKGIIPVDFAGYPINMESFHQLADEHGLWIIEDACHAPGGSFTDSMGKVQRCGNGQYADLAIFSFHPVKHIAAGEGGMITTNDANLYERLLTLRTHGITRDPAQLMEDHGGWYYEMQELGYNYRLTDFQCALGLSQLERADQGLKRRRAIARHYDDAFSGTNVKIIQPPANVGHAYHLYVIQVDKRKEVYEALRAAGIYSQVHYIPIPSMPYYQQLGYDLSDVPVAGRYYENCLSLPMYPALTEDEQEYVILQVLHLTQG